MRYAIGIDVGGTKIDGALVDESFKVIERCKQDTEAGGRRSSVIANIASVIAKLRSVKQTSKIGLGFPGYADRKGSIQFAPNLPQFNNFNLKAALEEKLGLPVILENDAHCFVLAESLLGAGRGAGTVLGLTLGTGIGGGAVIAGRILEGKSGGAAHFGHMIIDPSGIKCGCGQQGDLESWCGGRFMELRHELATGMRLSTKEIFRSGKAAARKVVGEFYEKLGVGIANLVGVFNPEVIVLGGGISTDLNYPRIRQLVSMYAYPSLFRDARILKNKLGGSAGMFGAAALAFRE